MTAVVTGGSAGIGRAIVEKLLERGDEVISLDVQLTDLKAKQVKVDLTDAEATRQAAEEIAKKHRVTTVIHNAGVIVLLSCPR
jgi:3-oxoacyl-[acyl-carrier protein] reductase